MRGTIKIKIEGLNASKIVNKLIECGVFLKNVKEKYKYIIFEIDERDENEFKNICKKYHKKYEILSKNNFARFIKRIRYYFGFLLAMVLISTLIFSFNLYVFQINLKVSSNMKFDTQKVQNLLSEYGVVVGMKKDKINKFELQRLIVSSDEGISGCSINQKGGKLEIEIIPAILKEEVAKGNIYSKYNAVLTKVNIFSGKTNLQVGDFVKIGDLLIENDNGASGEIFGKVYISDYLIYNENQQIKEFTGKIVERKGFELFGKKLFKTRKNSDFLNYIEENCVFYVSKYNFLPLKLVKVKQKEFNYKDVIVKFSEKENELKEKIYNDVLKKLDEDLKNKITNVTYSVVSENNLTRLDCFIECEINLIKE